MSVHETKPARLMATLHAASGIEARALEFIALTAARPSEVLGCVWSEFDIPGATWMIPAERSKSREPHRVPLSHAALLLLAGVPEGRGSDQVFGGSTRLTASRIARKLSALSLSGPPHQFRSMFESWMEGQGKRIADLAACALGRPPRDASNNDRLEERRPLMEAWAAQLGCDSR